MRYVFFSLFVFCISISLPTGDGEEEGREDEGVELVALVSSCTNRFQDISKVGIKGLLGVSYVDKVLNATTHTESSDEIRISGEVDRVYSSIPQDTTTVVADGKPRFDVVRDNLSDTVLWNPWTEKAKAMADFKPDEGFREMVCVEVGAVEGWTRLEEGETFEGGQIIRSLL